jgi:hypothetical protein
MNRYRVAGREAQLRRIERRLASLRLYRSSLAGIALPAIAMMGVLLLPIVRLAESVLHPPVVVPVVFAFALGVASMLIHQMLRAAAWELDLKREALARRTLPRE